LTLAKKVISACPCRTLAPKLETSILRSVLTISIESLLVSGLFAMEQEQIAAIKKKVKRALTFISPKIVKGMDIN
jgi:hypothetical protein